MVIINIKYCLYNIIKHKPTTNTCNYLLQRYITIKLQKKIKFS